MGNEHQALQLLNNHLQTYWQERSDHYDSPIPDVFGRKITESYIKKLKPQSLIEVGCGTGQLFPLYRNIPRVVGADWTDGMLSQSRKRLLRHEYDNITLTKLDITKGHLNDHFDLALTRTVLMHIPADSVAEACKNLTKMADTLLLFEFYNPNAPRLEWHNFHHEYPLIFDKLGYRMVEGYHRPDGIQQLLMIFKRQEKN